MEITFQCFWSHALIIASFLSCVLAGFPADSLTACAINNGGIVTLGVHLGLTHISAACLNDDGVPVPVTRIDGHEAYKVYMNDTIEHDGVRFLYDGTYHMKVDGQTLPAPPEIHNDSDVESIFRTGLRNIMEAAEDHLNTSVKIEAIAHPQHFNRTSRLSIYHAGQAFSPVFHEPHGAPPDDEPEYNVLIINHELDRVEIFPGEVDSMGPRLWWGQRIVSLDKSTMNSTGGLKEDAEFHKHLKELVERHLPRGPPENPCAAINTIMVAGELSAEAAHQVAAAISDTLLVPIDKITAEQSPYRAALGAACHAYLMANHPPPELAHSGTYHLRDEI
ncbi:hypothetical protein LTR99_004262 [Exophiala xenobiotica]|uniref:Carbohydrate kinase FGGY C-terminal domain-containing protein n=1 Tax=Vermiconidia calcicola TaxID=1690605 RepID=A0AAV9QD07_9PEZI|nr:hypothetical protein LTR99_004262 [Exophiala xenobiotica]KAK5338419.1 hypothetical protein LTR98_004817 [Exophiala xenobiotica]KAK5432500.1 hypothetical protein LTR34_003971 [Exophiala xenobiotica]KAK5446781.1 hypothetical protein LTR18_002358 [Exophiala xenobiotica]KAK5539544.1 hypothetical protein LTR25_003247 [Vermiconidia calcicola]